MRLLIFLQKKLRKTPNARQELSKLEYTLENIKKSLEKDLMSEISRLVTSTKADTTAQELDLIWLRLKQIRAEL